MFLQNDIVTIPEDALALLRERFLTRCREQAAALRAAFESRQPISAATDDGGLPKTVHSLAGAGGTFGFPDISARASELETLLIEETVDADAARHALRALIEALEKALA